MLFYNFIPCLTFMLLKTLVQIWSGKAVAPGTSLTRPSGFCRVTILSWYIWMERLGSICRCYFSGYTSALYLLFQFFFFLISRPYLGCRCNVRFLQISYFGRQVTKPLQLGSREYQSVAEHLKQPKDLNFDSSNHSIWDVFSPEFLSHINAT